MEVCDFFHEEHDRMGKNGVHSPSHTHTQTHTHTYTHTNTRLRLRHFTVEL